MFADSVAPDVNVMVLMGILKVSAMVCLAVCKCCSAILPAVYMSGLIGRFGTQIGLPHILWTALYSVVYIIPLYAILFNFIFTFKSDRISEKQGRVLKLIAGLFMFICGIIMVLKPTLLMA